MCLRVIVGVVVAVVGVVAVVVVVVVGVVAVVVVVVAVGVVVGAVVGVVVGAVVGVVVGAVAVAGFHRALPAHLMYTTWLIHKSCVHAQCRNLRAHKNPACAQEFCARARFLCAVGVWKSGGGPQSSVRQLQQGVQKVAEWGLGSAEAVRCHHRFGSGSKALSTSPHGRTRRPSNIPYLEDVP